MIVVKEGNTGRLIGKSGERINGIESDTKMKVRVVELKLDFKDMIRAVHPLQRKGVKRAESLASGDG